MFPTLQPLGALLLLAKAKNKDLEIFFIFFTSNLGRHIFIENQYSERSKRGKIWKTLFLHLLDGPTIYVEKILIYWEYVARIRNCLFIECFREFIKYLANEAKFSAFISVAAENGWMSCD